MRTPRRTTSRSIATVVATLALLPALSVGAGSVAAAEPGRTGAAVATPVAPVAATVAATGASVVALATDPSGPGYWLAGPDGSVRAEQGAPALGSLAGTALARPIVGMAATSDGGGYWLVASDGGIFSFGDAAFYGSLGGLRLQQPVVAMAATPDHHGYWLVAGDGGVFSFGDARFLGSTGAVALTEPIVGMAPTSGAGYWLVASDGGIFAFGDARFSGSTGGIRLDRPVVAMTSTPDGAGYWLVAADGGLFSFGDATFYGSTGGSTTTTTVGIVPGRGGGYELVQASGAVDQFGPAVTASGGGAPLVGLDSDSIGLAASLGGVKVVRIFHDWGSTCGAEERTAVAAGEVPLVSFKTKTSSGEVPWQAIAGGAYDSYVAEVARSCQALGTPVWVAFDHEPRPDPVSGTAADFVAAYRHWVQVVRAAGATDIRNVVIYMGNSFAPVGPGGAYYDPALDASTWYPGDDVVDIVGEDIYNWWSPTTPGSKWLDLAHQADAFAAWDATHRKQMVIPEFGSTADPADPAARPAWILAAGAWAQRHGVLAMCYFDLVEPGWDWSIDTDPASIAALRQLAGS